MTTSVLYDCYSGKNRETIVTTQKKIVINISITLVENELAISDSDNTIYLNVDEQNLLRDWLYDVDTLIREQIKAEPDHD
jgi:hypothetical protein